MTMFDSIIEQADERFNLGGKAGTLLSALLALMTDGAHGGLAGFVERFNQAGVDETISSSWVNSGANTEISKEQLESALGADALRNVAAQTGTDYEKTVAAAAFMTPRVIDALTPDGIVPPDGDLMSRIGGFLARVSSKPNVTTAETFDRVGTAAAKTPDADKRDITGINVLGEETYPIVNRVDANLETADDVPDNPSPLQWLLPLLLLGLLLVIAYWSCSKSPTSPASARVNINTVAGA